MVAIAQSLAALSGLETRATLTLLQEVLDLDLEVALPSVGRFGDGVLVAPCRLRSAWTWTRCSWWG